MEACLWVKQKRKGEPLRVVPAAGSRAGIDRYSALWRHWRRASPGCLQQASRVTLAWKKGNIWASWEQGNRQNYCLFVKEPNCLHTKEESRLGWHLSRQNSSFGFVFLHVKCMWTIPLKTFVGVYLKKAVEPCSEPSGHLSSHCFGLIWGPSPSPSYHGFPSSCGNSVLGLKFLFCHVRLCQLHLLPSLKLLLRTMSPVLQIVPGSGFSLRGLRLCKPHKLKNGRTVWICDLQIALSLQTMETSMKYYFTNSFIIWKAWCKYQ